jgi:hypothetical protein
VSVGVIMVHWHGQNATQLLNSDMCILLRLCVCLYVCVHVGMECVCARVCMHPNVTHHIPLLTSYMGAGALQG